MIHIYYMYLWMRTHTHTPHEDNKCNMARWIELRCAFSRTDKQDICLHSGRHSQSIVRKPAQINASLFCSLDWTLRNKPVHLLPSPECQQCETFH